VGTQRRVKPAATFFMEIFMTPEEVIAQVKKRAKHNFKTGLN
jgi:hypothetical protein